MVYNEYRNDANTEEERILEEIEERECAAFRASQRLEWTAGSGQRIVVKYVCNGVDVPYFQVRVANGEPKRAYEIVAVKNVPGIVAKVGNVGLTAERRDALKAMEVVVR